MQENKKTYVQTAKLEKQKQRYKAEAQQIAAEEAKAAALVQQRVDAELALQEARRREAILQAEEELAARIEAQARRQVELERAAFEASVAAKQDSATPGNTKMQSMGRKIEPRVPAVGSPALSMSSSSRRKASKPSLPEAARGKQSIGKVRKSIYDDYERRTTRPNM